MEHRTTPQQLKTRIAEAEACADHCAGLTPIELSEVRRHLAAAFTVATRAGNVPRRPQAIVGWPCHD